MLIGIATPTFALERNGDTWEATKDSETPTITTNADLEAFMNVIFTADDLSVPLFEGQTIKLAADVDAGNFFKSNPQAFSSKALFAGNFDGQGHKITNYSPEGQNVNAQLFGNQIREGSVVKGLEISVNLTGQTIFTKLANGVFTANCAGSIECCKVSGVYETSENVMGAGGLNCFVNKVTDTGSIANCINEMQVNIPKIPTTTSVVGVNGITSGQMKGKVENCLNTMQINVAEGSEKLTVLPFLSKTGRNVKEATNCFYTDQLPAASDVQGTALNAADLKTEKTFTDAGWDFQNVWAMGDNGPELRNTVVEPTSDTWEATKDSETPTITTNADLEAFMNVIFTADDLSVPLFEGQTIKLAADVDAGNFFKSNPQAFSSKALFAGNFDGQGHKITNYSPEGQNVNAQLFGNQIREGSVVKGLEISVNLTGQTIFTKLANGVFTANCAGSIECCKVSGVYETSENVMGAGGLNCFVNKVTDTGSIANCINEMQVNIPKIPTTTSVVGVNGITSGQMKGKVENCLNTMQINVAEGSEKLTVLPFLSKTGRNVKEATNCFYTDQLPAASDVQGTALNAADLKTEKTFTDVGWDFQNVWTMGTSGPVLKIFGSGSTPSTVDKTGLDAKIKEAQELLKNKFSYTKTTANNLTAAVEAGLTIYNKQDATEQDVQGAIDAIQQKMDALVDISKLGALIDSMKEAEKNPDYNEISFSISNVRFPAQKVYTNADATKAEVDEAVASCEKAMTHLVKGNDLGGSISNTSYNLKNCADRYTPESFAVLQKTYDEVYPVYEEMMALNSNQEAVDAAVASLKAAQEQLINIEKTIEINTAEDFFEKVLVPAQKGAALPNGGIDDAAMQFHFTTIKLNQDIDISGMVDTLYSGAISPANRKDFAGILDGQGHTISGFDSELTGLFNRVFTYTDQNNGALSHGCIKNLNLVLTDDYKVNRDLEISNLGYTYSGILAATIQKGAVVENCTVTGSITNTGTAPISGIAGFVYEGGVIRNCAVNVNIKAQNCSGIVALEKYGFNEMQGTIENCYVAGSLEGEGAPIAPKGTVTNCYYQDTLTKDPASVLGTAKTLDELKQKDTYAGWDFETIWSINKRANNGLPQLKMTADLHPVTDPVAAVEESIEAIGQVTCLNDESRVQAADDAYKALMAEEPDASVANLNKLTEAKTAIENLKKAEQGLKTAISNAKQEAVKSDVYRPADIEALNLLIKEAEGMDTKSATESKMTETANVLNQAVKEALNPIENRDGLEAALSQAEKIDKAIYTPESIEAFEAAVTAAQSVLDDLNADRQTIDQSTDELLKAIEGLVAKGDKAQLAAKIEAAGKLEEADYTTATWAAFVQSLDAANAVLEDENASQEDVNKVLAELDKAMSALLKRADKSELKAVIANAEKVAAADYTEVSYEALTTALDAARKIDGNIDAVQSEADAAAKAINAALDQLVLKKDQESADAVKDQIQRIPEIKDSLKDDQLKDAAVLINDALTNYEKLQKDNPEAAKLIPEEQAALLEEKKEAMADLNRQSGAVQVTGTEWYHQLVAEKIDEDDHVTSSMEKESGKTVIAGYKISLVDLLSGENIENFDTPIILSMRLMDDLSVYDLDKAALLHFKDGKRLEDCKFTYNGDTKIVTFETGSLSEFAFAAEKIAQKPEHNGQSNNNSGSHLQNENAAGGGISANNGNPGTGSINAAVQNPAVWIVSAAIILLIALAVAKSRKLEK